MWKAVIASMVVAAGAAAQPPSASLDTMCPMMTEGSKVDVVDTPDGVALNFSTSEDLTGLRARVHQMAESHNQVPGRMEMTGSGAVPIVRADALAQDTPMGAQMLLTADDPAEIPQLRQQTRDKVASCRARQQPGL
jgi:hypothetical protein